jgi:hypothetical protein
MTPSDIRQVLLGFRRIGFDEFYAVLQRHSMTENYALFEAWPKFQADPFSFVAGYNPRALTEDLLALAKAKANPKPTEVAHVG